MRSRQLKASYIIKALTLGFIAGCEPQSPDLDSILADFERDTGKAFIDCGAGSQERCKNGKGESLDLDAIVSCFIQESCQPRRASISILDREAQGHSFRYHFAFPDQSGKCEYHTFATPYDPDQRYVVHERCTVFRDDDMCERIHGIDCVEVDRQYYSNEVRE